MSFPKYPKYKASGVEWLGEVPEHWETKVLKHIVSTPITDGPHETPDFPDDGIPFVSAEAVASGVIDFTKIRGFISASDHQRYSEKYCPRMGDIYMVKSGATTGVTAIVETDIEFNIWSPLAAIRCGNRALPRFVLNFLRSRNFQEGVTLNWSFGTQQNIGMRVIENLAISLPPIAEQTHIASFLDRETAKIDGLVGEQRRLIELLIEKRQAVISHAVTKGLNPNAPLKPSGIEWPREVPTEWTVKRIKHLVTESDGIQMGPFGGMLLDLDSEETGFKVYGQENTISGNFELGHRWISIDRFNALSNYHIRAGDLLLTRKGSLGNARLVESLHQPGIMDSDTIRLRVDDALIMQTFLAILLHEAQYVAEQITLSKRGAILPGLNSETIANIAIVLPPKVQQQKLMTFLADQTAELDALTAEAERGIELLQERRTALISAAVTGKIDVRGIVAMEAAC